MLRTGNFKQVKSTCKRQVLKLQEVSFLLNHQGAHAKPTAPLRRHSISPFDQRERNHYDMISGFSSVRNSSGREGGGAGWY